MRYYIGVTTENDRTSLTHSPKGTTWKNHKYLRKEGGRYIYSEGKNAKPESMKKRKNKDSTGEMVGDSQRGGYLPDTIPKKTKKKNAVQKGLDYIYDKTHSPIYGGIIPKKDEEENKKKVVAKRPGTQIAKKKKKKPGHSYASVK